MDITDHNNGLKRFRESKEEGLPSRPSTSYKSFVAEITSWPVHVKKSIRCMSEFPNLSRLPGLYRMARRRLCRHYQREQDEPRRKSDFLGCNRQLKGVAQRKQPNFPCCQASPLVLVARTVTEKLLKCRIKAPLEEKIDVVTNIIRRKCRFYALRDAAHRIHNLQLQICQEIPEVMSMAVGDTERLMVVALRRRDTTCTRTAWLNQCCCVPLAALKPVPLHPAVANKRPPPTSKARGLAMLVKGRRRCWRRKNAFEKAIRSAINWNRLLPTRVATKLRRCKRTGQGRHPTQRWRPTDPHNNSSVTAPHHQSVNTTTTNHVT